MSRLPPITQAAAEYQAARRRASAQRPPSNQGANTGMPVMGDMMFRVPNRAGDDLRDPIGQINRLRQANQPIPESLQKAAFQFAAANNLDSDQLSKRLGVSVSDISQAAQGLGIQDQLPSSLGGTGFGEQAGQAAFAAQQNDPAMAQIQALGQQIQSLDPNDPQRAALMQQYESIGNGINQRAQAVQQRTLESLQQGQGAGQAGGAEQGSTQPTGLQKVADFISQGNKSDQDIYREMVKNDVSVEAMAGQLGVPVDEATTRYTRAQELSQIENIVSGGIEQSKRDFPNGIPDNLLRRYATESGQPLEQIATNMDNFGVSADDMSRATGIPLAEVQSAYTAAKGGGTTATGTGAGNAGANTNEVASTTAAAGIAGSGGIGLSGAERALGGGLTAAAGTVEAGAQQARQDVIGGTDLARQDLASGAEQAAGAIGASVDQGLNALTAGLSGGQQNIQQGTQQGLNALTAGLLGGQQNVQQGTQQGLQALTAGLLGGQQNVQQGTMQGLDALNASSMQGQSQIQQGANQGLNALGQALGTGRQDISQGVNQGLGALSQGLMSGQQDVASGTQAGLAALGQALGVGRGDIATGNQAGLAALGQA